MERQTKAIVPLEVESQVEAKASSRPIKQHSLTRTLTRLVVGGIMTGANGLTNRLYKWEDEVNSQAKMQDYQDEINASDEFELEYYDSSRTQPDAYGSSHGDDSSSERFRFAVIGMIFETENRVGKAIKTGGRIAGLIARTTHSMIQPLQHSRWTAPVRNRFNRLVTRGELEVQQWIETGQREINHSKKLADIALYDTVDYWIDYFAENPEVVELVTTQSVSFAEEVVEEVRERTVSADNFLESLVRTVFRQPTRAELPPPPIEAQQEVLQPRRPTRRP